MLKLLLPLVAVLAAGGSAAGAAVYLVNGGETAEDVLPPSVVQTSPEPSPAVTTAEEPAPAPVTAETPAPDGLATFRDAEFGFAIDHPAIWAVSEVPIDPDLAELDVLNGIEFVGKGGLPRARVFTFQNPKDLTLEDWIMDHDVIFFDRPPVEITIDGVRALLAPLNFAGQPSPLAYVKKGSLVFGLGGLTNDDYEQLVAGFRFDQQ